MFRCFQVLYIDSKYSLIANGSVWYDGWYLFFLKWQLIPHSFLSLNSPLLPNWFSYYFFLALISPWAFQYRTEYLKFSAHSNTLYDKLKKKKKKRFSLLFFSFSFSCSMETWQSSLSLSLSIFAVFSLANKRQANRWASVQMPNWWKKNRSRPINRSCVYHLSVWMLSCCCCEPSNTVVTILRHEDKLMHTNWYQYLWSCTRWHMRQYHNLFFLCDQFDNNNQKAAPE